MAVKWTNEQSEVIHSRGCSLLVAAAAGSGKTAVLTARILDRLMEEPHIDIDELLIVTFTEAAAAEMKERIRNGIEAALEEDPDNANLQKQSALVHCARITTIHSFCLSVIRDHFHVLDIDPGFRIVEEGEMRLLMHDTLDEILEEKYEQGTESFLNFADSIVTKRDDAELEEQILRLYEFSCSNPDPEEWLKRSLDLYHAESPEEMQEADWFQDQFSLVKEQLREYAEQMKSCLEICRSEGGPEPYIPNVLEEYGYLEAIAEAEDFTACRNKLEKLEFKRLKAIRKDEVDPDKKALAADMRNSVKAGVKKIREAYFGQSLEEQWRNLKLCEPILREMTELTEEFSRRFEEKKREQNLLDFSDMEHLALRILTKEEDGKLVPSDAAKSYQKKFKEIMIDEYQDSNLIQEVILTSVSGMSRGENNLFMVGDVKQSIYRFRLARPELFMEKYDTYPTEPGKKTRRIDLHKNFRSRREVLDGVNYIFRRIMRKRIGGIQYDEDAQLNYGASYDELQPNQGAFIGELWPNQGASIGEPQLNQEAACGESNDYKMELLAVTEGDRETEARAAAIRIKELIGTFQVTDGETKRPCRYGDIAVLFRSVSGWSDVFRKVFEEEGIPAYVGSRTGYFQTKEIQLMLQYLKLLNNPRQDFPLTAVMTSPMGNFTGNEMAEIRLVDEKKPFYECARLAERSTDSELAIKIQHFWETYELLREEAKWRPLHELIWRIVQVTGYDAWMAARPDGAQKEANISMLIQQAVRFESTSYKGVFHFVRYMDQLETYEIDYGEAETSGETDAVRFMSIHKSKGLEFPVVILAGMGKKFNYTDLNAKILLHPDAGIGMQAVDLKLRVRKSSVVRSYIRQRMKIDNLGEEIRVLYVALTRAKEKMIMTGRYQPQKNDELEAKGIWPGFDTILNSDSYMALIKAVVQSADSMEELPFSIRQLDEAEISEQAAGKAVREYDALAYVRSCLWERAGNSGKSQTDGVESFKEKSGTQEGNRIQEESSLRNLEAQFAYRYPYEKLQNYKMKFTVSELKMKHDVLEDGSLLFAEEEVVPLLPKFLSDEEEVTGAGRGSVYHKVMELLDFREEYSLEKVSEEIDKFTKDGYLTREMKACVNRKDILTFLESDAGRRMRTAAGGGKLYKEQPFVLGIPASEIYGADAEEEMLLVQGIIDVYFEEEDGLVVLDYKTDRVRYWADLKKKYEKQLDYYAEALEQMLHKPVKEKIIYSFTLQEEIKW